MVTLQHFVSYINHLLGIKKFDDVCPNGLQVQGRNEINKIIGGVTACQRLLELAVQHQADAVLVHHGYFWKQEEQCITGIKFQRISTLIKNNINLLAYHLPIDIHPKFGNNIQLAHILEMQVLGTCGKFGMVMLGTPGAGLISGEKLAIHIATKLGRLPLYLASNRDKYVKYIAWCTGAASHSCFTSALNAGVDAFLTGEILEQSVHFAQENGIHLFAAGHHATERYGIQALGTHLREKFDIEFTYIDVDSPV